MKYIIVILIVLVIKFILNLIHFLQCKYYLNLYTNWCKNDGWKMFELKQKIILLLKNANVTDAVVPNVEAVGYGLVSTCNISVFDNFPHNRRDMFEIMKNKFHEAIGVYRSRMIDTINPIFWVQYIIYLPKNILIYLGLKNKNIFIKIVQILWWIVGLIFTIFLTVYQTELTSFIKLIINNFK